MARAISTPPRRDEFSGKKLGKYEIACRLSTGGMSEVFLAFQRGAAGFRKYLVLKRILGDVRGQPDVVRMFVQEAKLTSGFSHSNIAHVYDLDEEDGELFLAMEFVPGATLVDVAKACIVAQEPIPTGFTLAVVRDIALALHYAHTFNDAAGRPQPVIHRDLAEKNIMVTFDGVPKLLDFGIAKRLDRVGITQVGTVKGTSGYMSPEQIRGEKLDARSDVFSLGVVFHECLSGTRLFFRKTKEEEIHAALTHEIPPPSKRNREVSPEMDQVVLKALERDRDARFASARELARAIERAGASLIWEREQIAQFMSRMFAERREQTHRLLRALLDDSGDSGVHEGPRNAPAARRDRRRAAQSPHETLPEDEPLLRAKSKPDGASPDEKTVAAPAPQPPRRRSEMGITQPGLPPILREDRADSTAGAEDEDRTESRFNEATESALRKLPPKRWIAAAVGAMAALLALLIWALS